MSTSTLRRFARLLPACILLLPPHTHAAPSAHPVDLASALQAASARDPELAQAPWLKAAAEAGLQVARSLTPAPATISLNHLNDRLNQNLGRREWEVEVGAPLWLPGQQQASVQHAQLTEAQAQAQQAWRHWQLAGELRERWWQLAQARGQINLAQQRLQTAQALEADVQQRYQRGDLARVDANLARTETLAAQGEWLEARHSEQQAQQAYETLTGTQPPAELSPEAMPPQANTTPDDMSGAHPQARLAAVAVSLAQSKLALADASRRAPPELALRWSQQRGDAQSPYDQGIGIKITLPLSSTDSVQHEQASVRANLTQAESALTQARQQIDQALVQAQAELAMSEQQLTWAQERSRLTRDNLQLAQRAFTLGEQDLSTLLRARQADHEAQAALSRQTLARLAAISRLRQALGQLPEETQP